MKLSTTRRLKDASQATILALFIILALSGRIQLWMGLFLIGMVLTVPFGRVYCGWVCPIHPTLRIVTWIKTKLKISPVKLPGWLQANSSEGKNDDLRGVVLRYAVLGVFAVALAFTMVTGKKLPVLLALLGIATVITMLFSETLWHRYVCPYGTLLSIPARFARNAVMIDQSGCIACGRCATVCPAQAVITKPGPGHTSEYTISAKDCLICLECVGTCPKHVIRYTPSSRLSSSIATASKSVSRRKAE